MTTCGKSLPREECSSSLAQPHCSPRALRALLTKIFNLGTPAWPAEVTSYSTSASTPWCVNRSLILTNRVLFMPQLWAKPCRDTRCHLRKGAKSCAVPLCQTIYRVQAHWAGVSSSLHCPDKTHPHIPQSRLSTAMLPAECPKLTYPGSKASLTPAHSTKLVLESIKVVFSSRVKYCHDAKLIAIG